LGQRKNVCDAANFVRNVVSTRLAEFRREVVGAVGKTLTVQNDMNFFVFAVGSDDPIHEIQKFPASAPFLMAGLYQTSGGFKSREQIRCAMPFVFMSKAGHSSR
jgi:hypothetical protein